MRYCDQCKVHVRGGDTVCPLCQNRLTGDAQKALYPEIKTVYRQYQFLFRLLIAATVSGGMICVGINLMLPGSGFWSVFVVFGILCFWISLTAVLKRRDNLLKTIVYQALLLSLLSVLLDLFIGWSGWSLDFFIPITYTLELVSLFIIAKVKKLPPEDSIVYLITAILFCVIPIVFYFTGLISVALPSVLCMTFSVITLVSLIVFEGRTLLVEVRKRFHL